MNNFGIGSKHGYTRLLSDSSINTTASDISHTSALPDKFIGVKNSAASNYQPDDYDLAHNGRSNRDNGRDVVRMSISRLLKEVNDSPKTQIVDKNLDDLIDKMKNNEINYFVIKKEVKTRGDLKKLHDRLRG